MNISTVIIGAGQAGLAASYYLTENGIDHVLLERSEVGNSWSNRYWDSLRLLTPNWQLQLPGYRYQGDDPDGYMPAKALGKLLKDYANRISAPVRTGINVQSVVEDNDNPYYDYRVITNNGDWNCNSVILANGAFSKASVPAVATTLPKELLQVYPQHYKSSAQLKDGGVLVVGASATGLQLAYELLNEGRDVTIAVGEHVRLPRRYRGRDIFYWLKRCGILDTPIEEADDIRRVQQLPSPQLVGRNELDELNINSLTALGANIVGRFVGCNDSQLQFSGSLNNVCQLADLKMKRLLNRIDEWITEHMETGDNAQAIPPKPDIASTELPELPQLTLDIQAISNVIWATGFKPDYSWLNLPVFDNKGRLKQHKGIVDAPGVYVLGLPFMRKHQSSYLFGASEDARAITQHLANYLNVSANRKCAETC